MKKITIAIFMLLGSFSMVSAEIGLNIGVTQTVGVFHATGVDENQNTDGTTTIVKEDAMGVDTFNAFFVEKTLPGALSRVAVGVSYVQTALSSATKSAIREDHVCITCTEGGTATTDVFNTTVQIDFKDLTTMYATIGLTENLYAKAGIMQVDVITNESIGTGASYGNTTLDGSVIGLGYNKYLANNFFLRFEGAYMDFENKSLTSEDNTIRMNNLQGASGSVQIGKTF